MTIRLLQGDARAMLATLADQSVHCVITSPPFWGLRAYSTPPQIWANPDGTPLCGREHEWSELETVRRRGQAAGETAQVGNTVARVCPPTLEMGQTCATCGCWRGELGAEPTVGLWVAHLVEIFAGVRRVLRDDGLCFVELGDSFSGRGRGGAWDADRQRGKNGRTTYAEQSNRGAQVEVADRNLTLAPFRFALAMQQAGWTLRQVTTLCRTAPMPESVRGTAWERHRLKMQDYDDDGLEAVQAQIGADRPTAGLYQRRHEGTGAGGWQDCPGCAKCAATDGYVLVRGSGRPTCATSWLFQFCKDGARYYYDDLAVRQPPTVGSIARFGKNPKHAGPRKYAGLAGYARSGMETPEWRGDGSNALNYQMIAPQPSGLQHFAMFPPSVPRFAILAGSPEIACGQCAAPWARVCSPTFRAAAVSDPVARTKGRAMENGWGGFPRGTTDHIAIGWRPTCTCQPPSKGRAVVLDCFAGAGTSGLVADRLGRDAVLIDLNLDYANLAAERLRGDAPLLAEVDLIAASELSLGLPGLDD